MDKEVERYLKHVRLPSRHWECSLDMIPDEGAKFAYKKTIESACANITRFCSGKSLYLYGPYGAGKSGCAAIIMKAAVKVGIVKAYWIKHDQIIDATLNDSFFDDETTLMTRLREVKLLVIDEIALDLNPRSSWKIDILEDLIRRRSDNELSTIITSNYTPDQVKTKVPSLYGILESFDMLELRGKNFRIK